MSEVHKIAVKRALAMLQAAGAKYKVIETDGTEHGELTVAPPVKPRTRTIREPMGTKLAAFGPYVKSMKPGDSVLIPWCGYDDTEERKEEFYRCITAWCSHNWGRSRDGAYLSTRNASGVELLYVAHMLPAAS